MSKIIKLFKADGDDVVEKIEEILTKAKNGEFKNFLFASEMMDGTVGTAWACCDLPKRQELISHLQIDVITGIIIENY